MVLQIVAQTYINFKYQKEGENAGPQKHTPVRRPDRETDQNSGQGIACILPPFLPCEEANE